MKIITPGKKKVLARRETCPYCGCVFEYEKKDLAFDQRYPQPFLFCPCCGESLEVENWKDYE